MNDPAAHLLAVCRRLIDPGARTRTLHAGHNGTVTLRAATTVVGEVIVKLHRGLDRHHQEVHAYQHWTPALGARAPRLLAISDDPPAIVVTALPGAPLADLGLTAEQEAEAHRQAGDILRRFHSAAPPRTEPDMTGWLAERGEHWLTLAEAILPTQRRAEIGAHLRALASLGPIPAVPCHLDYTPRNLLCATPHMTRGQPFQDPTAMSGTASTAGLIIAAVDFEHARPDLAARDLVRLATRTWPTRPDLKEAFTQSYGPLTDLDREIIEHCSRLDALTSAVRAASRSAVGSAPPLQPPAPWGRPSLAASS
jgi:Ser/Thr protein kinase RdoA (MazF antagonist)